MLILKTIICGRHLEENYKVTSWCTWRLFEIRPFCVWLDTCFRAQDGNDCQWMNGGGKKCLGYLEGEAAQQESVCVCPACLLACLQAGKKKMKFSNVLFLWQIQLLWGLVQSGATSKRQKLKTWQLMKWQMTRKFRQGPSVRSNIWRKIAVPPNAFLKPLFQLSPLWEKRDLLPSTFYSS